MKVFDLLTALEEILKSVPEAEQLIEWALAQQTRRSWKRSEWMSSFELDVHKEHADRALMLAHKRAQGTPLQYLTEQQEFYGRPFHVEPGVLIPRPETEVLVEEVLKRIKLLKNNNLLGFELGLGAGPIAVTLLAEVPGLLMKSTEVSDVARRIALQNATTLLTDSTRLELLEESEIDGQFDFMVSNPPYLNAHAGEAEPSVRLHEPSVALFAPDTDLLYFYRHMKSLAEKWLKRGGFLALEIPHERAQEITELFLGGAWKAPEVILDLNSRPRVLVVTLAS